LLLAAGLVLSGSLLLPAQKFLPKSIQFKGDAEYTDQELLAAAGLKKGAVLTSAEMQDHAKQLMDSGVFDNLTYKFDGIDLVFSLIPAAQLYPLRLQNLPLAPGKELDAQLHERFPLYHGKVPAEGGLMEQVRQALEEMLAAKGISAAITATPSSAQAGKGAFVSLAIAAPPVLIGEIHPDTASVALDSEAEEILAKLTGSPYDRDGSPSQIATYLGNFYRDQGYLEADIHANPQGAPVITPEAIRIPFLVSVSPGQQYKLKSIQLAPGLAVTQAEFDRQSTIHPGDIAGGQRLTEDWVLIARLYHDKGYMRPSVHPTPSFDRAPGTVSFGVSVESGPVYTMGKLSIENVGDDLRPAMLAAWKMPAGAVFNESAVRNYFFLEDADPLLKRVFAVVNCRYNLQLNDVTHTVDVVLRLEKRP
jgi:outer membrane protein insertion porin family